MNIDLKEPFKQQVSAEASRTAHRLRALYDALVDEDFDEDDAIDIVVSYAGRPQSNA